jgi:hypothetical protein
MRVRAHFPHTSTPSYRTKPVLVCEVQADSGSELVCDGHWNDAW